MVLQRVKKSEGCQRLHRSIKINSSGTFQPIDHPPQSQADIKRRHAALQTDTCHPPLPSLSPEWSSIKSERRRPLPVLWASQLIWPRFTWENPLGSTDVPCLLISGAPSAGVLSARHPADCGQLGPPPHSSSSPLLNTYAGVCVSLINVTVHQMVGDSPGWVREDELSSIKWLKGGTLSQCFLSGIMSDKRKACVFIRCFSGY